LAHLWTLVASYSCPADPASSSLVSLASQVFTLLKNYLASLETCMASSHFLARDAEGRAISEQIATAVDILDSSYLSQTSVDLWQELASQVQIPGLARVSQIIQSKILQKNLSKDFSDLNAKRSSLGDNKMNLEQLSSIKEGKFATKNGKPEQKTEKINTNFNFFSLREASNLAFAQENNAEQKETVIEHSKMIVESGNKPMESYGLSRAENFLKTFIKANCTRKEKPSELISQKQSSKAISNASVINLKANKTKDLQGVQNQKTYRRVLSNVMSTRLVAKPMTTKTMNSQYFDKYCAPNCRESISAFNDQQSDTQGFLMNFMNFEDFNPYPCPDSPNHESTQSGNRWLANRMMEKKLEMPSPAKSTHSVTKDNYVPVMTLSFGRLERTPEKGVPAGLFKNSTNLGKDRSVLKAISKSKRSVGKESCRKVSAAKVSGFKLQRAASAVGGVQQRIAGWDSDIVAFGTPVKEDLHYTEPDGRFRF
jgi:hypothetical protein